MTILTLTDPDLGVLPLTPEHGWHVTAFDPGWPVTRRVVGDRTDADGTRDDTAHHGARTVTITAQTVDVGDGRLDPAGRLAAYCHPARRPALLIDTPGRPLRRIDLVVDQWTAPITSGATHAVQVSWQAPSGLILTDTPTSIMLTPATTALTGRTYNLTYDRVYPAGRGDAPVSAPNAGTAAAQWQARIYGPVTDPTITTVDGVVLLATNGLTITSGNYVAFNSATRTVTENDNPAASRRSTLDFASTTWAPIPAGGTALTLAVDSAGDAANAVLTWHDTWLR